MGCLGGRTVDDDLRSAVAPTALFVLFVPSRYRPSADKTSLTFGARYRRPLLLRVADTLPTFSRGLPTGLPKRSPTRRWRYGRLANPCRHPCRPAPTRSDRRGVAVPGAPAHAPVADGVSRPLQCLPTEPADRSAFAVLARRVDAAARARAGADGRGRPCGPAPPGRRADPHAVYRGPRGADRYAAALAHPGARVDVRPAGLDITVFAPKSVSVICGLGPPEVAAAVVAAHRVAVGEALGYLEIAARHALRGHHGDGHRADLAHPASPVLVRERDIWSPTPPAAWSGLGKPSRRRVRA